mmetsp:Transcript_26596/g.56349  ORF Transcript_26596/g.56349 Transcript_26596/m.56349 type:complete len:583 (+) Transcript_26596:105-1853(+)
MAAALAKQLPTRSLTRAANEAFGNFTRLTARRHLLTPSAAVLILRDALDEKVQSYPHRGKTSRGLNSHDLGSLYADRPGLREVVAVSGGLKKLVEQHGGSTCGLAFDGGNLRLAQGNAGGFGTGDDEVTDIAMGLTALVKVHDGRVDESTLCAVLHEERFGPALRSPANTVEAHGGLEAFVGKYCKDLLWRSHRDRDGELISVSVLLAEATQSSPGSVLTSQQFAELCDRYPNVSFEDHLVYLERSSSTQEEYLRWRQERRLVQGSDPAGLHSNSLDLWYGEACLVCLRHCPLEQYKHHAKSAKHQDNYWSAGGLALRTTEAANSSATARARRPPSPLPSDRRERWARGEQDEELELEFWEVSGLAGGRVLILGEADFSFSAAVAAKKHQASGKDGWADGPAAVVATTLFSEYDPMEPEVWLSRGQAVWYPRRSLSSFGGLLEKHLEVLRAADAEVLYEVDATELAGTLSRRTIENFDTVVFPFPQASPCSDGQNAILIRRFFRNVARVLKDSPNSRVQIMILESQYVDWDIELLAQEANLILDTWLPLPMNIYTIRFLAGKAWRPRNAVFVSFRLGHFSPT